MDIQLKGITKTFDDHGSRRIIFQDMELTLPRGEFSVIVGKSGVGKSSLLNLISGIDAPDRGEIHIGDNCLTRMDDTRLTLFRRRHIGFIFQFFHLIPVLTVLENALLVAELDGGATPDQNRRARELLDRVGLAGREKDFPDTLSGGEQQRVAIARALVPDPPILLADEPTGNLDQETGKGVLDMLLDLARNQGKTLVMVTHSRGAMDYTNTVYTVTQGQLIPRRDP
ncbi:MAG: ABC transporter ATP-binding protein [Desulfobacterales bacterium]|nr:ABC transporter ATP-binding protein [Desulfobacterales bacterium]